jgi:hypothetical protein
MGSVLFLAARARHLCWRRDRRYAADLCSDEPDDWILRLQCVVWLLHLLNKGAPASRSGRSAVQAKDGSREYTSTVISKNAGTTEQKKVINARETGDLSRSADLLAIFAALMALQE